MPNCCRQICGLLLWQLQVLWHAVSRICLVWAARPWACRVGDLYLLTLMYVLMCCAVITGTVAELCKDPAAEAWILAELNSVGKENKVRRFQGTGF